MTQKIAIITSEQSSLKKSLEKYFSSLNYDVEFLIKDEDTVKSDKFDIIILDGIYRDFSGDFTEGNDVIRIHPSLLPAFDCENPMKAAFCSGVKLSGVTIHKMPYDKNDLKILAQYPIMIGHGEHFDEFCQKIEELAGVMLPPVVKSILDDTVFDWTDMFNSGCSGGGCGRCCSNKSCKS